MTGLHHLLPVNLPLTLPALASGALLSTPAVPSHQCLCMSPWPGLASAPGSPSSPAPPLRFVTTKLPCKWHLLSVLLLEATEKLHAPSAQPDVPLPHPSSCSLNSGNSGTLPAPEVTELLLQKMLPPRTLHLAQAYPIKGAPVLFGRLSLL